MAAKSPRLEILHFATETPFQRVFRSCETTLWHTSATSQHRTPILQLRNGLRKWCWNSPRYENAQPLRNPHPLAAKSPVCYEKEQWPLVSLLNDINSIFPVLNGHLNFKKVSRGAKPEHIRPFSPTEPWLEPKELSPRPHRLAWESQETRLSKVPPPSLRGHESSHLRLRTHLSVLRPGVITQEGHLPSSSSRGQKSGTGPPKKKTKVSEPIDLTESSSEPTPSLPPAKKSPPPAKKPQPSQTPARESQIPPGMTPEVAIRRLMVTQPPIKGNYDCRARPFHSELCFDIATFRLQPELRDSFHLLQRYHMEHLLTPRDFFYPHVALDFY